MTRKDAGLTLIEVLITLTITAVLLTVGLPAFTGTLDRTRVATTMHRVSADLAMARSTAIMRPAGYPGATADRRRAGHWGRAAPTAPDRWSS